MADNWFGGEGWFSEDGWFGETGELGEIRFSFDVRDIKKSFITQ